MITKTYIGFASEHKATDMTPAITTKIPILEFEMSLNKNYTDVV